MSILGKACAMPRQIDNTSTSFRHTRSPLERQMCYSNTNLHLESTAKSHCTFNTMSCSE